MEYFTFDVRRAILLSGMIKSFRSKFLQDLLEGRAGDPVWKPFERGRAGNC
jgi:hypothetical protein